MTGSPTDGLPWWGKVLYAAIMTPIVVCDKMSEIAKKVMPRKKEKSNVRHK